MKKKWSAPKMTTVSVDLDKLGNVSELSDVQLITKLEQSGYQFSKRYQASKDFIYRKVADVDVLISIGSNVADFNGYIELNKSAVLLWDKLQNPCSFNELVKVLEEKYVLEHIQAVNDVLDFINVLKNHNMIMVVSDD